MKKKKRTKGKEKTFRITTHEDSALKAAAQYFVDVIQADVITYVLFSGSIENPSAELLTGISTYRIHPIIMKGENADVVLADIQKKIAEGQALTKEDLFPLLLCPLMSGTPRKKRGSVRHIGLQGKRMALIRYCYDV